MQVVAKGNCLWAKELIKGMKREEDEQKCHPWHHREWETELRLSRGDPIVPGSEAKDCSVITGL